MAETITINRITLGAGRPKICVPITSRTVEEIIEEGQQCAAADIDLVEWRVDRYVDVHIEDKVLFTAKRLKAVLGDIPMIFTCRTEDGQFAIEQEEYSKLNRAMIYSRIPELIDIELSAGDQLCHELTEYAHCHNRYVILSSHDFEGTPDVDVLVRRMEYMRQLGGDIPKIAVMPQRMQDVLKLLRATDTYQQWFGDCPIITMAMGQMGSISRVGGGFFGSALTFASMKAASAPGQLSVDEIQTILDILYQN